VVLKKCVMINCAALGSNPSALYTELVFLVRSVSLPFLGTEMEQVAVKGWQ